MALDQPALLEVLEVLKVADVGDRVRQAAETIYQALIEAELTETIGAALHERTDTRTDLRQRLPDAGVVDLGRGSGAADPKLAPGRSSRRCWNAAAEWTRRCSRW